MKKRLILGLVVFLLAGSFFALGQEESQAVADQPPGEEAEECGFWCKAGKLLWGTGGEEKVLRGKALGTTEVALAGKAGGIWGKAVVGRAGIN